MPNRRNRSGAGVVKLWSDFWRRNARSAERRRTSQSITSANWQLWNAKVDPIDHDGYALWLRGVARRSSFAKTVTTTCNMDAMMALRYRAGITGEPRDTESDHAWCRG